MKFHLINFASFFHWEPYWCEECDGEEYSISCKLCGFYEEGINKGFLDYEMDYHLKKGHVAHFG